MFYLEKVGVFGLPGDNLPVDLDLYLGALLLIVGDVPARKTGLALAVLKENKSDLSLTIMTRYNYLPF